MISYKTPREVALMREAGRIVAEVHAWAAENVRPGMTTGQIDDAARGIIERRGASCTFLGYHGFPRTICTSVNEEVVHGIPGKKTLAEGDIIGIDVGATYRNYMGDAAITVPVGRVSEERRRLVETTRECLEAAIRVIGPGVRVSAIGAAVQTLAESRGYGVVREYAGHGIGTRLHEDPQVPNYVDGGTRANDVVLRPGMVICVEPMLNMGCAEVEVLDDGWTVVTKDRKPSAHFEHTIAVTEDGAEVLSVA
ncbi:MAG: type I methionyl aminopeptidase [Planctomycetaceae bacterium]|nr:type I methionyl aminopeptidase [Planctomycetota bacterium]NUN51807.1 type I methionyl aminopeptidase [Planctomycetaceae bacterium]